MRSRTQGFVKAVSDRRRLIDSLARKSNTAGWNRVRSLPSMIQRNGLLRTLVFLEDSEPQDGEAGDREIAAMLTELLGDGERLRTSDLVEMPMVRRQILTRQAIEIAAVLSKLVSTKRKRAGGPAEEEVEVERGPETRHLVHAVSKERHLIGALARSATGWSRARSLPSMIQRNGLLRTLIFLEDSKVHEVNVGDPEIARLLLKQLGNGKPLHTDDLARMPMVQLEALTRRAMEIATLLSGFVSARRHDDEHHGKQEQGGA
ncbi:MAG: type III-B CRISPR module-associated protein Cmr5 [Myxococcota bacterium]